jgi:hypothetical protein
MHELKALVASNIRDNKMVRRIEKNIKAGRQCGVLRDTKGNDVQDFFQ